MFLAKAPSREEARENYIDNPKFSQACHEYVILYKEAEAKGEEAPRIPRYIAECFIKLANGLSRHGNYIGYSWRDEMVEDAVENCLKALKNFNIDAVTRGGEPNAFGYFNMVATNAFLRRIAKEKKQHNIKKAVLTESQGSNMVYVDENIKGTIAEHVSVAYYDDVKRKMNEFAYDSSGELFHKDDKEQESSVDETHEQKIRKYVRKLDSDLEEYFE